VTRGEGVVVGVEGAVVAAVVAVAAVALNVVFGVGVVRVHVGSHGVFGQTASFQDTSQEPVNNKLKHKSGRQNPAITKPNIRQLRLCTFGVSLRWYTGLGRTTKKLSLNSYKKNRRNCCLICTGNHKIVPKENRRETTTQDFVDGGVPP
jgi:hypothetical protein